jgi:hypothetical protein
MIEYIVGMDPVVNTTSSQNISGKPPIQRQSSAGAPQSAYREALEERDNNSEDYIEVELVGVKVKPSNYGPIHICNLCKLPILVYGRLVSNIV